MENVYTDVLRIKKMSLPTINVKNTSKPLKEYLRYNNHIMTLSDKKRLNDTELSRYLRKLIKENVDYNLQWSIKVYAYPYKCGTRTGDLRLTKKIIMVRSYPKTLLNKRTELVSKCRHVNVLLLLLILFLSRFILSSLLFFYSSFILRIILRFLLLLRL